MDINSILSDLKAELSRITQAIAALESLDGMATATPRATVNAPKASPKQSGRRRLTAAGRKRLSEMMKKRWALRRKQATKSAPKKASVRHTMTPAARKRISEAAKKRWAERKAKTA